MSNVIGNGLNTDWDALSRPDACDLSFVVGSGVAVDGGRLL